MISLFANTQLSQLSIDNTFHSIFFSLFFPMQDAPPREDTSFLQTQLDSIFDEVDAAAENVGQKVSEFLKSIVKRLHKYVSKLAAQIHYNFGVKPNGSIPQCPPIFGSQTSLEVFARVMFLVVDVVVRIMAKRYLEH